VLGHVHFRPVTPFLGDDEENDAEDATAQPAAPPADPLARAVGRTLVVKDPARKKPFRGLLALHRLADAVPFGRVLTLPARLPLLDTWIERRLERASAHSADFDAYFELEAPSARPESPPPDPTPVRLFARRSAAVLREGAVFLVVLSCGSQVLIENRAVPKFLKPEHRPEWMTSIVVYPRLFQGWSMFAPSPPSDDGRVIVDGITKDGRHLDPLTGKAPDFDVQPKLGYRMNQIWGDFHRRIGEARFEGYLEGVRDMLRNYHQITGNKADELVSFDVYFVNEHIPPPGGAPAAPEQRVILSWSAEPGQRQPRAPRARLKR
jgi:hypothetical protein